MWSGYAGYSRAWGQPRPYASYYGSYRGYPAYGYTGYPGSGVGGWSHFPGQRDLPSNPGYYSNYVDNWGNDTPNRISNWYNDLSYENSVRRSNINSGLEWNRGNTDNMLRNSFRRMHNQAAVDQYFRRY